MKKKLDEATFHRFGFPDDGSGVAGDDDMPPGNIVLGTRYKRRPYFNRLTKFNTIWDKDDSRKWTWDFFDHSKGMEDKDNYSRTIYKLQAILPQDTWKDVASHLRDVPDSEVKKRFIAKGQAYRDADDVLGRHTYASSGTSSKNEEIIKKINLLLSE